MGIDRGHRGAVVAVLIAGATLLASCVIPPTGPGTTTTISTPASPIITSFVIRGGVGPAPAVVALAWTVSDPNGDEIECRIDGDGDGIDDVVVTDCPTSGSRNVELPDAGSYTARLTVDDGTTAPASTLRIIDVDADPVEPFDLELRGVESLSPTEAAAFTAAADTWQDAIVRGIDDFPLTDTTPDCVPDGTAPLPSIVDDVIIDVSVVPIDGAGGILGQAGPTCINIDNELSLHGVMQFDAADVDNLIVTGSLTAVITHEMGHVLGLGTLWNLVSVGGSRNLLSGAGGANPRFTGARAGAEYDVLGGTSNIPVENSGGPGTRDSHWRESNFDNELMTGYINPGFNPLSAMSIASLADMGYQVDLGAADGYVLPGGLGALRVRPAAELGEMLRPPIGTP